MTYDFDVLIVGAGPVGLTLALVLNSYGHRVTVLERHAAVYPLPRAVSLSHENVRLYDGLGLHKDLFQDAIADIRGTISDEVEVVGATGDILLRAPYNGPSISGTSRAFPIHQPALECALEEACKARGIDVMRSTEVKSVIDMDTHVEVSATGPGGTRKWAARFVAGCDGANSIVRRSAGIPFTDCPGPRTCWVVVDVRPRYEGAAQKWGDFFNPQLCMDPRRPRVSVYGTKHRKRRELMLMSDEEINKATDPAFIWSLLAEFNCNPENAIIDKSVAYTFKGGWCETLAKGRILLAGDSGHVTPPFLGQGLNSGIRDVNSLGWRLSLALRYPNSNWHRMFEDWSRERLEGIRELIKASVAVETSVTITDVEKAKIRDENFTKRAPSPLNLERLGPSGVFVPPSDEEDVSSTALGSLFVDGPIRIGGKEGRLCDHFGTRGWLILAQSSGLEDGKVTMSSDTLRIFSEVLYGKTLVIGKDDVQDTMGTFSTWFNKYAVMGVLLRPDNYVYGIAKDPTDLEALVESAAEYAGPFNSHWCLF